jgi:hypothetical protein
VCGTYSTVPDYDACGALPAGTQPASPPLPPKEKAVSAIQAAIREAVATVEAMTDDQITLAHNSGLLDRRYKRAGCQCPTCPKEKAGRG